jgi:hypothetical protein
VIKFVSDVLQVSGFLQTLIFLQQQNQHDWNIVENEFPNLNIHKFLIFFFIGFLSRSNTSLTNFIT